MKKAHGMIGIALSVTVGLGLMPAAAATAAPHSGTTHETIQADGVHGVTDSSYDSLFAGGSASKGVLALIEAGKVRVNDAQVPRPISSTAYSTDHLDINGGKALWENADGTWSWTAHITLHGENETYATAAVGLVNAISTQRGLSYRLTLKNGIVTAIKETVYDAAFADVVKRGSRSTTIRTLGSGDDSTDKPNPTTLRFANANVTGRPTSQSMVKYWDDAKGWHLQRAASKKVRIDVDATTAGMIPGTIGGKVITDSRVSLQYSQPWNRPSQPVDAMEWLGLKHVAAIQWFGAPGVTIGFSFGGNAKTRLRSAIAESQHALDTVAVSAAGDGSDVAKGAKWVTQAYHDTFAKAIADAKAQLKHHHLSDDQYAGAWFLLAQAYGGHTGDHYSEQDNVYFGTTGTGFWTFAQAHLGTRA